MVETKYVSSLEKLTTNFIHSVADNGIVLSKSTNFSVAGIISDGENETTSRKFHFGLIVDEERITKTKKGYSNFYAVLNIQYVNPIGSSIINLVTTKSKAYSYLLENNVSIGEDYAHKFFESIPFIPSTTPLDLNNDTYRAIYCNIMIPLVELRFDRITPSDELTQALGNALSDTNPYVLLYEVFKKFGHLVPRKMIIGKKLSRNCQGFILGSHLKHSNQSKKKFLSTSSEKFDEIQPILNEWKNLLSVNGLDSTYFMSSE
ncbi:5354_t:CDS:2, partial [Acaulospora morrowiae]